MIERRTYAERDENKEGRKWNYSNLRGRRHRHFNSHLYCMAPFIVSNKNKLHNAVNMSTEVSEKQQDCMTLICELWGKCGRVVMQHILLSVHTSRWCPAEGLLYSSEPPLWTSGPTNHSNSPAFLITLHYAMPFICDALRYRMTSGSCNIIVSLSVVKGSEYV